MAQSREPSMEDILASIKKVIAEEKELRTTVSARADTAAEEPRGPDDDQVLELEEAIEEEQLAPPVDLGPPLVSEDAAVASRMKLAALQEVAATAPPPPVPSANALEQVVKDMLRPLLKEWLDQHLPEIVDEHVRREISRITGQQL